MNRVTALFIMLFLTGSIISSFAQIQPDNEKVWSKIFVDQGTVGTGDPNYKWEEQIYQPRYYELGGTGITVNPNFRPLPTTNTTQSELSVDVHPFDENIVFCSSNATPWPVSGIFGTGVYWTLDGAATWTGFDNPPFGSNSGDPASVIGTNGNFYEGYIHSGGGNGIAISTNNGTTWSTVLVAPNPGSLADKNHLMSDKVVDGNFDNNVYSSWTDFGGVNDGDVVVRYSTNFGSSWSSSINISNSLAAGSHSQGVNVQIGPNSEVYAAFAIYDAWPGGEDAIGFAKSTDGGVTWTSARVYSAVNFGIRGTFGHKSGIRVSSFPSMAVDRSGGTYDGTIYITWPQINVTPAGTDPDIVMIKSTDGGTTWTSPVRVNDDPINNGKDQYYPWCTVDQSTGQLMFVWYDSRETTNDSAGVWMARSVDGGSTFENFRVSDQNFKPKPIPGLAGGYQGDYIGVAALNDIGYPYWADDRTGNYQGWMSVVNFGPPCPIAPPSNPAPADGAIDVPVSLAQLSWTNGAGATQMELWFGEAGSMTQVYTGSLITSWPIPTTLNYSTTYQWRVIGANDTCSVNGPIWSFTTEPDPNLILDTLFCDDFESGLGLWTVTNLGGTCVWEIFTPPYPNSYTLPATSSGGVLAADSDECGSGSTMNTTSEITQVFDLTVYTSVWIEFDNDWNVIGSDDEAHVEISIDGGSTWTGVWDQIGSDIRNTHEVVDVTGFAAGQSSVQFRLRSVQPGWDWWWAVDNFCIYGMYVVPVELTSFNAVAHNNDVELNWSTATETNNQGFEIERKTSNGNFEKLGYVAGFGTTTESKAYSYMDTKVPAGSYIYRLKQIDFDGSYEYSPEVAVEVSTPIEYALEQNYPNPFNPSTVIKYSIPEDATVKLAIYNLLGEEVALLVNTQQKAGRYEVEFNAGNLASGIYIYRLETPNFRAVKKLMLMK